MTGLRRPRFGALLHPFCRRDEAGFTMVIWTMGLAVVLFAVIYLVTDAWRLIADSYRGRGKNIEAQQAESRADDLSGR